MSTTAETDRLKRQNRERKALQKQEHIAEKLEKDKRKREKRKNQRDVRDYAATKGIYVITLNQKTEYNDPYAKKKRTYEVDDKGRLTDAEVRRIAQNQPKKNRKADQKRNAKKTYPKNPTPKQAAAWERHPGRYDIKGVDTVLVAEPIAIIKQGKGQTTLFNIKQMRMM